MGEKGDNKKEDGEGKGTLSTQRQLCGFYLVSLFSLRGVQREGRDTYYLQKGILLPRLG